MRDTANLYVLERAQARVEVNRGKGVSVKDHREVPVASGSEFESTSQQ